VELLVVIGIIALLISILLPSLHKARESANRVTCGSNIRQQGLALFMYANDNKNSLPWGNSGHMNESWRLANSGSYDQWWQIIEKYSKTANTWVCPSMTRNGRYVANVGDTAFWGGGYAHALPRVLSGPVNAPTAFRQGDPHEQAGFAPMLNKYAFATGLAREMPSGKILVANKLSSAKGRRILKYEQYALKGADMANRGDLRHLKKGPNGNIVPAGGNILWSDGSVTWTGRTEAVWPWDRTIMMAVPEE
jgi:type II secretory pathway pseudopilin PulG